MPIEEEFRYLFTYGSFISIVISAFFTIYLWTKNKEKKWGYVWVLLYLFFTYLSLQFMFNSFNNDIPHNHPMFSEEITPIILIAWFNWILSIGCLLIAVFKFTHFKKR